MIFDADAHVEENIQTFASMETSKEFVKAIPRISEGARLAFRVTGVSPWYGVYTAKLSF